MEQNTQFSYNLNELLKSQNVLYSQFHIIKNKVRNKGTHCKTFRSGIIIIMRREINTSLVALILFGIFLFFLAANATQRTTL